MARVLIPIPRRDFDPTEVAVSWEVLTSLGPRRGLRHTGGETAAGDELMLTGEGLDPWGWVPGLRKVAPRGACPGRQRRRTSAMRGCARARSSAPGPVGVGRAGGRGRTDPARRPPRAGMRVYLESERLQSLVVEAFHREMPVGAICHGVLLAARSIDPKTSRSVLYGRRTTALTWELERTGWRIGRISRFWDPRYYRTYDELPGQPEDTCPCRRRSPARWQLRRTSSTSTHPKRTRGVSGADVHVTRSTTPAPPSWSRTASTPRRGGRVTLTPSRDASPRALVAVPTQSSRLPGREHVRRRLLP